MENDLSLILQTLQQKAVLKQDVFAITKKKFDTFKKIAREVTTYLETEITAKDSRVKFGILNERDTYFEAQIAGDLLVFIMHTNIFDFDKSHYIWKTSYVQNNHLNAFCGMISVYNFLSDSFKYNRVNDLGYLIARIFVNREEHFFVEGKRQLSFLYNDFIHSRLTDECIRRVLHSLILYSLSFDLLVPPYEENMVATVSDMKEISERITIKTGKRLGFQFNKDDFEAG